ncbi:MAG: porin family protein [Saprospiraceae bacterium]
MKKLFFLPVALFALIISTHAQVRFGVKAGLNLSNVSGSSDVDDFYEDEYLGKGFNPKIIPSFVVGAQVEYDFSASLGISSGLQITGKGFKLDESFLEDDERITYDEKTTAYYLQIPVQLTYHKGGFFGAVGPYVGFGIAGKYRYEYDDEFFREEDDGKIEFTNDVDVDDELDALTAKLNPIDFGAGLELGYEFTNLRLSASYSLGLTNIYPKDLVDLIDQELNLDNFKASHRVISIGATWMFGERE